MHCAKRWPQFDGAICRSGVKITADVLAGNHRLKAIVRAGVGTDNIDKEAATRLGIVVMNTPAGNTLSTAEHTWALMLALSRNVAPAYHSLIEHKWDRKQIHGHAAGRKDARHRRPGAHRPGGRQAGQGVRNARAGLRSVSQQRTGRGDWASSRSTAFANCLPQGRLSHGPHAADG